MNDKYSLENLVKTFQKHHEISEKDQKEFEKRWIEEHGSEYPHKSDFEITLALKSMCEEILHLRD